MTSVRILSSLLKVPDSDVQRAIDAVRDDVEGFHYDVMDGKFVPPVTFSAEEYRKLRVGMFCEIHLMVHYPDDVVDDFARAGAKQLTIHFEAEQKSVKGTLEDIKKLGCLAGLCIKPKTFVEDVDVDLWDYCDSALIMSVEPGWGGQSFMPEVLDKVRYLREKYPEKDIGIDGGINDRTGALARHAGCSTLVSGTYIYGSLDLKKAIDSLRVDV